MEGERVRQRRYVRLPEDCVSLCMENLGIQASREVTSVLVEDVSFRIRQVTKVSQLCMSGQALQFPTVLYSWHWSLQIMQIERESAKRILTMLSSGVE